MVKQGETILVRISEEMADQWNDRPENGGLPGDLFVKAIQDEWYPGMVISIRDDVLYLKVWPIGGGAMNVKASADGLGTWFKRLEGNA